MLNGEGLEIIDVFTWDWCRVATCHALPTGALVRARVETDGGAVVVSPWAAVPQTTFNASCVTS